MKLPTPKEIAEQIVSVQPMPANCISDLLSAAKPESELLKEGYRPIDKTTRLTWVKNEEKDH